MSHITTPTTVRRSTATFTNAEEQEGPTTVGSKRPNEADSGMLFGESPSKKGSSSVKYGGKRKPGGGLGTPGSTSSPIRPPDSRRESLSTRLKISRDISSSAPAPTSTSKRKNTTSRGGSKQKPTSSAPVSASTRTKNTQKLKNLKRDRAAASISISSNEEQGRDVSDSELSELTTPPSSPVRLTMDPRRKQPPSSMISAVSISSSSQPSSPQKPINKAQKPSTRKPKALSKTASWAPSTANGKLAEIPETWSLDQLGNHVWVMLGLGLPGGRVLVYQSPGNGEGHQEDEVQWCWWPAKLERSKDTLIFTPYSLSTSKNENLHLPVANASFSNVLSFSNTLEHVRFENLTFLSQASHNNPSISAVQRSPKKKRKLEKSGIEAQFDQALAQALEDEESLNDGVPSLYNALSRGGSFSVSTANGSSPKKGKGKRKEREAVNVKDSVSDDGVPDIINGAGDEDDEEWEAVVDPGADELLDIPGERVLCRAHKNPTTEYWPAQVIAYVPPPERIKKKRKGKIQESKVGRYRVLFLDEGEMEVPRDWFYASHEDEFGKCKLGKFQSEFVDNPNDAGDDEGSYSDYDFEAEFESVSQSSGSTLDPDSFSSLSLSSQFVHVIPVLQAILNNNYPPTRDRNEKFIKGGKSRSVLLMEETAGFRGRMNPKDGDVFAKMVQGWCLGSSKKELESEETTVTGAVDIIEIDDSGGPSPSKPGTDEVEEVSRQANGVQAKVVNTEQEITGDSAMILDVGDTHMDVLDKTPFKENVSPHSTLPMEIDAKPQSENVVVTDIPIDVPEEAETSVHAVSPPQSSYPPSSITTPPVELELDDRPGLAPPLPLLIPMQGTVVSQDDEEESPLTPIAELLISAPPAVFEGNGERPRRKRERQVGCESYEALGGVEKVSYTLTILFPIVIRQILLWRDGSRSRAAPDQLQVLSDEEEWELYRKGEELVRETDWVFDVRRLRENAEKQIQREEGYDVGGKSTSATGRVRRASRKILRE
ncbi:hypothetical protein L218DRAFT_988911 [Marasmius fiardii PR-910]|nr:hypothetical protein L218DRAFT_988911 [Marasmius fiardii PR-910]